MTINSDIFAIQDVFVNNVGYGGGKEETFDRKRSFLHAAYSGNPHETLHSIITEKADIAYSSVALKQFLAAMGSSGTVDVPYLQLDGTNGAEIIFAQAAGSAPGYQSTALHVSRKALNGLMVLEGIRWSKDQAAEIMLRIFGLSADGVTNPWTPTNTRALPAQDFLNQAFTLTSLNLNGNAIGATQSIDFSVGHKFSYDPLVGNPYAIGICGAGAKGPLEFRLTAEVNNVGSTEGTGAVSMTFTNYLQGGTLGTTTVVITLAGGWTTEDSMRASAGSAATKKLTVFPKYDGTTKPMTWVITN